MRVQIFAALLLLILRVCPNGTKPADPNTEAAQEEWKHPDEASMPAEALAEQPLVLTRYIKDFIVYQAVRKGADYQLSYRVLAVTPEKRMEEREVFLGPPLQMNHNMFYRFVFRGIKEFQYYVLAFSYEPHFEFFSFSFVNGRDPRTRLDLPVVHKHLQTLVENYERKTEKPPEKDDKFFKMKVVIDYLDHKEHTKIFAIFFFENFNEFVFLQIDLNTFSCVDARHFSISEFANHPRRAHFCQRDQKPLPFARPRLDRLSDSQAAAVAQHAKDSRILPQLRDKKCLQFAELRAA